MDEINFTAGKMSLDFTSAVEAMIKKSCIIDYGIIQKVVRDGVVNVSVAVSRTSQDMVCLTCVLANLASSSLTLDVTPHEGDRVLVVYPRIYDDKMFKVAEDEAERKEILINKNAGGYSLMSGIAFLANQYKRKGHKNYIKITDGTIEGHLAYDSDDEKNLLVLNTQADGSVALDIGDTEGDEYCKIGANADGSFSVENKNGKFGLNADGETNITSNGVTIDINKDDEITVTGKGEIKMDKNGNITIDGKGGKVSVKNNMASLYSILDGMLTVLNTSLATAGSPASHTVVPQQFAQQSTQLGQLMQ